MNARKPTGIFLLDQGDTLTEMSEEKYISEDLLQDLVARHPNLLAGDQMDSANPRRWLLIGREVSIPDRADGAGRWAADHLFLDQDGIPTIVEVKRSTDSRIRREVVAQMFDYAAYCLIYFSVDRIQTLLRKRCEKESQEVQTVLSEFLGSVSEIDHLWADVHQNIQSKRIRLVFVSDQIPEELKTVVEFLNEQMNPAEVLAVEIKKYEGQGNKVFVPRVFGLSETAKIRKRNTRTKPWSTEELIQSIRSSPYPQDAVIARQIVDWAEKQGLVPEGGYGGTVASVYFTADCNGSRIRPFSINGGSGGDYYFQVNLGENLLPCFSDEPRRAEFIDRLNGLGFTPRKSSVNTSLSLRRFSDENARSELLSFLEWVGDSNRGQ